VSPPDHLAEHTADRPSWDCHRCGKPWPCDPAREQLATELGPVQLSVYMWASMEEAAGDLPDMPSAEFFDRFLRWIPNKPLTQVLNPRD
jgi:hypothetical protein